MVFLTIFRSSVNSEDSQPESSRCDSWPYLPQVSITAAGVLLLRVYSIDSSHTWCWKHRQDVLQTCLTSQYDVCTTSPIHSKWFCITLRHFSSDRILDLTLTRGFPSARRVISHTQVSMTPAGFFLLRVYPIDSSHFSCSWEVFPSM
jgi:hypothetical protein